MDGIIRNRAHCLGSMKATHTELFMLWNTSGCPSRMTHKDLDTPEPNTGKSPVEEAPEFRKNLDEAEKAASIKRDQRIAHWVQGAIVVAFAIFFITKCTN